MTIGQVSISQEFDDQITVKKFVSSLSWKFITKVLSLQVESSVHTTHSILDAQKRDGHCPLSTFHLKDDLEDEESWESTSSFSVCLLLTNDSGAKGQSITFHSVSNRYITWNPGQPNKVEKTESQNCLELWPLLFVDQMTWLPIVLLLVIALFSRSHCLRHLMYAN